MGRNKVIQCEVCMKSFRSDRIKTHREHHKKRAKYPMKRCTICKKNMIAWNLKRHEKVHSVSLKQIQDNMQHDQSAYDNMLRTREMLKGGLNDIDIDVKSLRKEYAKALEINSVRARSHHDEFGSLKSWQTDLLKMLKPSQRNIIWVTGKRGGEGKSYFQGFIEHHYGSKRVFRCSIVDKNAETILHILSKTTLALMDVFLFNIPRSFDPADVPYALFEDIKDGRAISNKYDSKILNFLNPNTLIVFSNEIPYLTRASEDRWETYRIVDDKLEKELTLCDIAALRNNNYKNTVDKMCQDNIQLK